MAESSFQLNQATTTGDKSAAFQRASDSVKVQEVVIQTQTASSDPVPVNTTNPMPIQGNVASLSTDSGNPVLIGAQFNTVAPTVSTGQRVALQTDVNGNIKVNIAAGAAAGGTSSTLGAAVPGTATMVGFSDGTNMRAAVVDGSGNLKVNIASGGVPAGQDNTSFTSGTTQGLPTIAVADITASVGNVTQGNQGILKMTLDRKLLVAPVANITGGWSPYSYLATASNNATNVKASAGSLGFVTVFNVTATVVFFKLYNKASAPAPATDNALLVGRYPVPASTSGAGFVLPIPAGLAFSSGISFAIVANISDTDNTSVAANCVTVNLGFI